MRRIASYVPLVVALLIGAAQAQPPDNPVTVRLEIYLVSEVTADNGTVTERFTPATSARPGQIVEYRLFAVNESDETLPAGIVIVTGPVPDGTTFVPGSATPSSERILTEFSAPGSDGFSEPPVIVDQGGNRSTADPESYGVVRWTLRVAMEPGQEETFIYRVTVE